ncbi:hypothetical protein DLE54_03940 [Psychrobacter sp. YP14]|uniref:DUF8198 domain-containing protein n=3 Tax=Psychrobacter TaxID=497 RepID=A0A844LZA7_9GAMM|nr:MULTISPECIES: hypothetical protein [Psychrobacter]AWT48763.1 hypothetical protein DLE54_03940 [Psychrobacter sp. YP14]MUG32021.1 hypothetical protein [Psychrobacter sanguinis]
MSALSNLNTHLKQYWELPHHNNPELTTKLSQVQNWQKDRIRRTHAELFSQPKNKPMAEYFLNHLYGGDSLDQIVRQLEVIVPKAQKLEKLAPTAALETGTLGVETAITSTKLDLKLAQWLLDNNLEVNEDNMQAAYVAVNDEQARRQQIEDLKQVCYRSDKYLNSFILQKTFKLAKKQAYKRNLQPLYDFIDSGFAAMKPLKSVGSFIDPFCERELQIIDQVHSA